MLITEAIRVDASFGKYLDFGRKLTAFYYEERYPPGPVTPYSREEVEETMNMAQEIIDRLIMKRD